VAATVAAAMREAEEPDRPLLAISRSFRRWFRDAKKPKQAKKGARPATVPQRVVYPSHPSQVG